MNGAQMTALDIDRAQSLRDWLRANDIDPMTTSSLTEIRPGVVAVVEFLRDEHDGFYLLPGSHLEIASRTYEKAVDPASIPPEFRTGSELEDEG